MSRGRDLRFREGAAVAMEEMYIGGEYFQKNPAWHVEDSLWKTRQILRMMARNGIKPGTVCEVGCGAGEILRQLQLSMDRECAFWGYEISPQAFELSESRANERLHFRLADIRTDKDAFFDLILIIDVIEHLEDYFGFLRDLRPKSKYKILHIPLDISSSERAPLPTARQVEALRGSHPLLYEGNRLGTSERRGISGT